MRLSSAAVLSKAGKPLPKKRAVNRVVDLLKIDETREQWYERFPFQLLQSAYREHHIRRRAMRAKPVLLLRRESLRLTVSGVSRSNHLEKDMTYVCE